MIAPTSPFFSSIKKKDRRETRVCCLMGKNKFGLLMGYEIYGLLKFRGLSNFRGLMPLLKWLNYWASPKDNQSI